MTSNFTQEKPFSGSIPLIMIGLLLVLIPSLKSQNYVPFPMSNAIWNNMAYWNSCKFHYRIGVAGDTMIAGKAYSKLMEIVDDTLLNPSHMTYKGAIREEQKRIFVRLEFDIDEYLLYDFSLSVGDTLRSLAPNGYLSYSLSTISQIDSVQIHTGDWRKRFIISPLDDEWIEGIGSKNGLLYPATEYLIGTVANLACLKQNDSVVFLHNTDCNACFCGLLSGTDHPRITNPLITLHPNPTTGTITVTLADQSQQSTLTLTDRTGKTLRKWDINQPVSQLHLDDLPKGVYLMVMATKGSVSVEKIVLL